MRNLPKATVLGLGSWGTALASVISHHAKSVSVWGRNAASVLEVNQNHANSAYLPGLKLSERITATTDLTIALAHTELVISAVPTKALEPVFLQIKKILKHPVPVISTSKGLCPTTFRFPTTIIRETFGWKDNAHLFCLSGPSFAKETLSELPTAVTLGGEDVKETEEISRLFFTPYFRTYPSQDIIGMEVAGALKNVIAIAAGIGEGLKLGANAQAALITRGLAEMSRFGASLGASPMTFLGLAGMGDLVLTCTGSLSRNRTVGMLVAQGFTLEQAEKKIQQTAEGVTTARSVHEYSIKNSIDMPICAELYAMLFEKKSPRQAIMDLMGRPMRHEHDS